MSESGFIFRYQPIILAKEKRIYGYECLLRVIDPVYGELYASEFLPVVNKYPAFSSRIENWSFNEAAHLAELLSGNDDISMIAFNIDKAGFFSKGFTKRVEQRLRQMNFGIEKLWLEFGSEIILRDRIAAERILLELRAMGLKLVIDNADLELLKCGVLAVDMIKIKKEIVSRVNEDFNSAFAAKKIIEFAARTGIRVCALGVENAKQEKTLLKMGCKKMQGFYYSKYSKVPLLIDRAPLKLSEDQMMNVLIEAFIRQAKKNPHSYIPGKLQGRRV